jgi:tRNA (uracil-5-)-methyltransferase
MEQEKEGTKKRLAGPNKRFKNKKQKLAAKNTGSSAWRDGSNEEVLLEDIRALLKSTRLDDKEPEESSLPELQEEITLEIAEISSTGDALAVSSDSKHVFVVPFAVPGDVVVAKPWKHFEGESYSLTDLIKVTKPSSKRDDSLIRCPYFTKCSGCQFQMLPYKDQLAHKRTIVQKAYQNFSSLTPSSMPEIGETIGSPLQYSYRTKLTPHFDGPPSGRKDRRSGIKPTWPAVPPIGFMLKGTRKTIDIEDCPIGTDAVRRGMKRERERVTKTIDTYRKGATILLRESTERIPKEDGAAPTAVDEQNDTVIEDRGDHLYSKSCITDSNATSKEYIDDFIFTNPAGSFFQNNNSILSPFTQYIRDQILPKSEESTKISYLVDAYCGSGLFTITLSSLFKRSIGIDISSGSIKFASENAKLNNLPESQATFMEADAAKIFEKIDFPAAETVVVIDPPRKGCDQNFLSQLLQFGPQRIVYVSCNVHTQARDVGVLVNGLENVDAGFGSGKGAYEIENLRGFDFFPQTGHVEGVAVLKKRTTPPAVVENSEHKGEDKQLDT